MTSTTTDKGRLDHLDGVRGIASLMVILHHAMLALHPSFANYQTHYLNDAHTLPFAPVALLWQGNLCVCVFFVLSGYVLAPAMLKTKSGLAALFARRLVRLGLPTLAALLFGYGLMQAGVYRNVPASAISGSQGWWGELFGQPASLWEVLRDTALMPFQQITSKYDPVVWTMHVEYFGSFLIFAIYKILKSRRLRIPLMCVALYFTLDTYYFDFVAGAMMADLGLAQIPSPSGRGCEAYASGISVAGEGDAGRPSPVSLSAEPLRETCLSRWERQITRRLLAFVLFALFILFGANVWSAGSGQPFHILDWLPEKLLGPGAESAHQLAAVFLLGAIISSPLLQNALSWRPIVKLGHISFGTYLLHLPLLSSLGAFLLILTNPHLGYVPSCILLVAVVIGLTLSLAVPFTRYIDSPTNTLSHKIGKRVDLWNQYCTSRVGKIWHHVRHGQAS